MWFVGFYNQEAETIYTHHQKTVIVDADADQDKRKIIAFVGGLDLCKGRYDTPNHSIFRTLQTVHKDDYHNPSFKVSVGSKTYCHRFSSTCWDSWSYSTIAIHDLHTEFC